MIYRGSFTSGHFITFICNDYECKILFIAFKVNIISIRKRTVFSTLFSFKSSLHG